jgi:CheY-like chemotaxis protein
MNDNDKSVFLADDDIDDCFLFQDALSEVSTDTKLSTANDGIELMTMLEKGVPPPPDVIFLDLNMPRKNGFECLVEIKSTDKYKGIPVVIFSTSCEAGFIDKVYKNGADYYLCKPGSFQSLKTAISKVLSINWKDHTTQPARDQFLLTF